MSLHGMSSVVWGHSWWADCHTQHGHWLCSPRRCKGVVTFDSWGSFSAWGLFRLTILYSINGVGWLSPFECVVCNIASVGNNVSRWSCSQGWKKGYSGTGLLYHLYCSSPLTFFCWIAHLGVVILTVCRLLI
jgi:hypothetical protein